MKLNNPTMVVSRISGWVGNKDDVSIPQGTSFRIYSGKTLVWDMLVTKDFKGDPCIYENITSKFYYWENNNEK